MLKKIKYPLIEQQNFCNKKFKNLSKIVIYIASNWIIHIVRYNEIVTK